MRDRERDTTRLGWRAVAGVLGLVVVTVALHRLDHPLLTPPDLAAPETWPTWATTVGPVGLLMSLLRLAALGMCWYLLLAAGLQVVASVTGARRLSRLADLVVSARTRDVLVAVVGTGLLASATLDATVAHDPVPSTGLDTTSTSSDDAPRLRPLGADGDVATSPAGGTPRMSRVGAFPGDHPARGVADVPDGPRLRPLDDDATADAEAADAPTLRRVGAEATPAPSMVRLGEDLPSDDQPPDDRQWWTVAPGDHFWHVAEEQVALVEDDPGEARVRAYWRRLVDVNRDRLVDPDNPDLLLPGQVLLLPPTSTTAAER